MSQRRWNGITNDMIRVGLFGSAVATIIVGAGYFFSVYSATHPAKHMEPDETATNPSETSNATVIKVVPGNTTPTVSTGSTPVKVIPTPATRPVRPGLPPLAIMPLPFLLGQFAKPGEVVEATFASPNLWQAGLILVLCAAVGFILLALAKILNSQGFRIHQSELLSSKIEALNETIHNLSDTLKHTKTPAHQPPPALREPVQVHSRQHKHEEADNTAVLTALKQLHEALLMTDSQKHDLLARMAEKKRHDLKHQIGHLIEVNDWQAVEAILEKLRIEFGAHDTMVTDLTGRVGMVRAQRARQDAESAKIQLRQLLAANAWPQAEEIMIGLLNRYPDDPNIKAMAEEVRRERTRFEHDIMSRMFTDMKECSERRDWRRALQIGEEICQRYTSEPRVEQLRNEQLSTLRQNAEAQERREEEELFKEMVRSKRYDEALGVAHRVINKFPTSTTAAELSKLLPKIDELSKQDPGRIALGTVGVTPSPDNIPTPVPAPETVSIPPGQAPTNPT